jgi:hypothetical protein
LEKVVLETVFTGRLVLFFLELTGVLLRLICQPHLQARAKTS